MTTLTHTLFGIVLAKVSMDIGLVPHIPQLMYPLGICATNAPDIDALFIHFPKNHRLSILHAPLFWMTLLGLFYLIHVPYIPMLSIGVASHFLFDTFDMRSGIRWLYPIKKRFFNILHTVDISHIRTRKEFMKLYFLHPVTIVESGVLLLCVIAFLKL